MNAADMAKELADLYGLKYATQVNLEAAINKLFEIIEPTQARMAQIKPILEDILDTIFDFEIPTGNISQ